MRLEACADADDRDLRAEIARLRAALDEIWEVAALTDCADSEARGWIEVHAREALFHEREHS